MTDNAEDTARELVGRTLGEGYRLDALIGQGAMGAVYRATAATGAQVAVKTLRPQVMGDHSQRFLRESELVRGLEHPHVVRTLDSGADQATGLMFLVMPLVKGRDLDRVLEELGALEPQTAVRIALQAASGLTAAHRAGIIHRDVKPGNLILDEENGKLVVRVCDFGVAKQLGGDSSLTATGSQLGTPDYVSPEQLKSSKHVDERADVWSLGATLYQMLGGAAPYSHIDSVFDVITAILTEDAPHLQDRAPWLDAKLCLVVHKSLQRDPSLRWASMAELARALGPFSGGTEQLDATLIHAVSAATCGRTAPRADLRDAPKQALLAPRAAPGSDEKQDGVKPPPPRPRDREGAASRAGGNTRERASPKTTPGGSSAALRTRYRLVRVVLLALSTLIAIPASFVIRSTFFPPKLDVPSIERDPNYQDPVLLQRAWQLPVAASYRAGLLFQPNGSLCGPTSVANVQRSLGKAGASPDSVLAGRSECWTGVCWGGLSLDALADVTRQATGRRVTLLRGLSLAQFREELRHVNDPARRYIVNFQRAPLFAQGGGHHSPIAAYLQPEDLVLVLDVNESFRPWLVKSERLFQAMDTADSGKKRGLLRIE